MVRVYLEASIKALAAYEVTELTYIYPYVERLIEPRLTHLKTIS
jgi:hypothetical protein